MSEDTVRSEFLEHISNRHVLCASLEYNDKSFVLPVGFTKEQYELFLAALDFEYHGGYGIQELFGTIWYEDGTWSGRGEYDGSEWWEHYKVPIIPEELSR